MTDYERNFTLSVSKGELLKGKSNLNDIRHEVSSLFILTGNAPWNQRTSLISHSFMYVKHYARFSLFWFLLLCWNMLCLRKSTCTVTITFKLTYHIQSIDIKCAKHPFFLFPSAKYLTLSWLFEQLFFFLPWNRQDRHLYETVYLNNSLFFNYQTHSFCIYFCAVAKFTLFLTCSHVTSVKTVPLFPILFLQ